MDQTQQYKPYSSAKWRPILLLLVMCAVALLAAVSISYGAVLIGVLFLMVMGGIFTVIFLAVSHPAFMAAGASFSVAILQVVGGFSASLMGMTTLIAAFVMAYLVRQRAQKTSVLVIVSVILGGGFLLIAAALYAIGGGSLAPNDLLDTYQAFFHELKIEFSVVVHEWIENMDAQTLALYAQMKVTKEMLLDSYLDSMEAALDMAQLMLPGMLLFAIQLLAYMEISAFRIVARTVRVDALLPEPRWKLVPTQISCVVYLAISVVYVLGSFFAEGDSIFMIAIVNLWLALLPTMLLCGVRVLVFRLKHPMYRMGTGMIVAIFVFGLFFVPSVALVLALFMVSFLGAQTVSAMHAIEAEKNKKQ